MSFDYDDPRDADLHRAALRAELVKMGTALPGLIVSYDAAARRATVQPVFKGRTTNGAELRAPQLQGVPVLFPGGAVGGLTWALEAGDEVLLIVCQRRLALWLERAGEVDPWEGAAQGAAPPLFRLQDAVALPGVLSSPRAAPRPGAAAGVALEARSGATVHLGDASATAGVALGDKVQGNLEALAAAITKLEAWARVVGALPSVNVPYDAFTIPPLTPPSVALEAVESLKVKTT